MIIALICFFLIEQKVNLILYVNDPEKPFENLQFKGVYYYALEKGASQPNTFQEILALVDDGKAFGNGEKFNPVLIGPDEYLFGIYNEPFGNGFEITGQNIITAKNHNFSIWAVPNSEMLFSSSIGLPTINFGNQRINIFDFNVE